MDVKVNPVGRLHDILVGMIGKHPHTPVRQVWAEVFACDPSDTQELLSLIVEVIRLTKTAREAVASQPRLKQAVWLEPFDSVQQFLSVTNLDSHFGNHSALLGPKTMQGLQFGENLLEMGGDLTASIPGDEIRDLLDELGSVLGLVLDSDLPPELKRLFVGNLEHLRHALISFRISGLEGLVDEMDRSWGSLARHSEEIIQKGSGEEKNVVVSFFKFLERVNQAATFTQNLSPLLPMFQKLIGSIAP